MLKNLFLILWILFYAPNFLLYAQISQDFNKQLDQATYLLFSTKRGEKELEGAISILAKLNEQEDIRIKRHPKESKNLSMMLNYAYALYYKAAYTFPRENESKGKEYVDIRLKYYRQAEALADEMLKYKVEDKKMKAEVLFTAGMIKGEIASLTSSPFLIIKGRNLLEQALKTDSNIRNGAIYLGLGRMYAKTPRILFGNQDKSLQLLHMAQKNFAYPSIVSFYFEAETILDDDSFEKVSKPKQILAVSALLAALEWEAKRIKIPFNKPNALTPEEIDALRMIRLLLKKWGFSTQFKTLQVEVPKFIAKKG